MESEELFHQSCRICSSDRKHGVMLFGEQGKKQYLQAKIRKYLYVTVTAEDTLPKMICEECCKRIEGIHKFATMAVKNQDKLKKLVSESNFIHKNEETVESKGLLHTYLTKGIKDQNSQQDPEITEMEVKVDPMLFLQCGSDDDESTRDAESDCESEETTSKNNGSTEVENGCDESSEQYRKPYQCSYCPRGFTSDFALQGHVWNHLPQNRPMVFSNLNNSPYSWQDKQDHNKYTVARSTSTTSSDGETSENGNRENSQLDSDIQGGFKCPICGKPISTKGNLKVHLETHRPKGKYGCDSCGRIFKTQCNLHRHKEYHGGIQYTCDVCGRVYPTNSTLRAHSITHSDLRPHKCPLCVKTFKRNQDLKFHINQHTGARPYRCPYCPKAFASSGNCFSHRKRMHPMEVERDREKAAKIMR